MSCYASDDLSSTDQRCASPAAAFTVIIVTGHRWQLSNGVAGPNSDYSVSWTFATIATATSYAAGICLPLLAVAGDADSWRRTSEATGPAAARSSSSFAIVAIAVGGGVGAAAGAKGGGVRVLHC